MSFINLLDNFSNFIDRIVKYIVFVLITAMIVAITMQIVFRVFFQALTWSEEISRYLLVWSSFLGATMAYKRGMHINVTFAVEALPKKMIKFFQITAILLTMLFFAIAIFYGVNYMTLQIYQVSAALRIPMKWVYLVMPLSFSIMFLHGVVAIKDVLITRQEGEIK